MKNRCKFIHPGCFFAGVVIALVFSSCASNNPADKINYWNSEIIYPYADVNGKPMRIEMDTNNIAGLTLTERGAQRSEVKPAGSSSDVETQENAGKCWLIQPVGVKLGTQSFTAQFAVLAMTQGWDIDGLVGWPGIRDNNVLYFDSSYHIVRHLDQLPIETSGWLKLKIHPSHLLALEIPLSNGHTGVVCFDTGDLLDGVTLPLAQYTEWKAAHPSVPSYSRSYDEYGVPRSSELNWADEIHLGPITLTDVPVRSANADEPNLVDNFAGIIGLYAFERMDLILDNKSGYAYLRPKPSPGPPYAGFKRPSDEHYPAPNGTWEWTVADDVQINPNSFLIVTSQLKAITKDYDGAIQDINHLIEAEPNNREALSLLSKFEQKSGRSGP